MDVLSFPSPTKRPPSPHTTNHVYIFLFLCYFSRIAQPLFKMAYNQKNSVLEASCKALGDRIEAYFASYQHWDLASPQHSNTHTDRHPLLKDSAQGLAPSLSHESKLKEAKLSSLWCEEFMCKQCLNLPLLPAGFRQGTARYCLCLRISQHSK